MNSTEWKETYLGEIAEIVMGQSPAGETCNQFGIGLPLLNGPTEFGNYSPSPVQFTTDPKKTSLIGDLLFCVRGSTTGRMNWSDQVYAIGRGIAAIRHIKGIAYQPYLKALIEYNLPFLLAEATGSTFPNVSSQQLNNLSIKIPSLPTQRRIAEILSSLDDKIELNRQTNITLEAIAQSIFKEWFIDFNFPGATGEMIESEMGLIPKGWRYDSILEVAELLSGGTPSTKINEYWNGDIKWISAKDVSSAQGSFVLDTERKITKLGVKNSSTKILPRLTTIVTARGTVGSYCILSKPMAMNQTNYGLKAKEQEMDYFVFFSLASLVAQLQQASYGTIFDTVTTITFEKSKIIIPPYFIMQKFDYIVRPLMETILGNLEQSNTLSGIRDSILPKLMNGEINV